MGEKLTAEQVCDSKEKYSLLSAEYIISITNKAAAQSYYLCSICEHYHVYTIQKKVVKNRRSKIFYKDEKEVHLAKLHKRNRPGFKRKNR